MSFIINQDHDNESRFSWLEHPYDKYAAAMYDIYKNSYLNITNELEKRINTKKVVNLITSDLTDNICPVVFKNRVGEIKRFSEDPDEIMLHFSLGIILLETDHLKQRLEVYNNGYKVPNSGIEIEQFEGSIDLYIPKKYFTQGITNDIKFIVKEYVKFETIEDYFENYITDDTYLINY